MELLNEEQIKSMTSEELIGFINHYFYQEITVSLGLTKFFLSDDDDYPFTQEQIDFLEIIRDSIETMLKLTKIMMKWKPLQKV